MKQSEQEKCIHTEAITQEKGEEPLPKSAVSIALYHPLMFYIPAISAYTRYGACTG